MNRSAGFTLIELMVVVSIIGILASIALPNYQQYMRRAEVVEALSLGEEARARVTHYQREQLAFPTDNLQAGLPRPEQLIGNRVTGIAVEGGAVHVTLGNKVPVPLQGKILSFRPATVDGSPSSPISWLCGYDEPVSGMSAVGDNKTDVPAEFLPSSCRTHSRPG